MQQILLLEDDAALGHGVRMALQAPETVITLCATLSQGRAALLKRPYDLLLLDINLPDGSGLELLRESKALRVEVPVLLLTANDLEADEVAGLELGADDYIIFYGGAAGPGKCPAVPGRGPAACRPGDRPVSF
ncbi:MAG: response regulator [Oscillospiraceae bacterium]|nr:response regulator [Oscillospiraceae bacterium]